MRTENGYNNMIIPSSKRAMRAVYEYRIVLPFVSKFTDVQVFTSMTTVQLLVSY